MTDTTETLTRRRLTWHDRLDPFAADYEALVRRAEALVTSGLWVTRRDGWAFHDWAIFQPDAASQRAKREAESTAGSLGNHRRWHEKRGIVVADCEHCQASSNPSGTRSGGDRGSESPPNPLSGDSPPNPPDPARTRTRPDIGSPSVVGDGDQASNVTFVTREPGDGLTLARSTGGR